MNDIHAAAVAAPTRPTFGFMLRHPARWFALGFGSGLAPKAPGTVGTLWAWVVFLLLDRWAALSPAAWGAVIAVSLLAGVWACKRCAEDLGLADPGNIVWDEVVAFWIVLWLVMPVGFWGQLTAFVLFRFFDTVKPGPIGWVDQHFKTARGWMQGLGIMVDDLVAALCTLLLFALWKVVFA
jgi:phosphatidylglycerophosphatase A